MTDSKKIAEIHGFIQDDLLDLDEDNNVIMEFGDELQKIRFYYNKDDGQLDICDEHNRMHFCFDKTEFNLLVDEIIKYRDKVNNK